MERSTIEQDNALPPKGPRNSLAADLLARLPELGANENIFYPEPDKDRQKRLYNSLYVISKRHNLNIAIRFYDDGLRVWKVAK